MKDLDRYSVPDIFEKPCDLQENTGLVSVKNAETRHRTYRYGSLPQQSVKTGNESDLFGRNPVS